jgi:MFS family permease
MAYGLDPTGAFVGFVTSAFFFVRVFIELPSGVIAARVGRRKLVVAAFLLGTIGSLLCALSHNIYLLIVGITVWGLGAALFFLSSTSLLFDLFETNERGKGVGTFQSIEQIGMFLGAPLGAMLVGPLGFQNIFIVTSMVYLCAFLMAFFSKGLKSVDAKFQSEPKALTLIGVLGGLRNWGLATVSFIQLSRMLVIWGIMLTVFQLYLNIGLSMGVELIGLIMGDRTGGMIIAAFAAGQLADKVGSKLLIVAGLVTSGICLYMYTVVTSFTGTLILATIDGAGSGFAFVSLLVFMSDLVPQSIRSGALGVYRTFQDIGGIAGPIIFMFLYTSVGACAALRAASLLLFLNAVIVFFVRGHAAGMQ